MSDGECEMKRMSEEERKSAEKYCESCRHIEMCRWYPYEGCEFLEIHPLKWIPCNIPPNDDRSVFIAYSGGGLGTVCIGYYDKDDKCWREHRNWFASLLNGVKYWCEIPELPDGWKE